MRRMVPARTSILRPAMGPDTASRITSMGFQACRYILSNFVPSSAVSGVAGFFTSSGACGSQAEFGGAGTATAGPLLIKTIGDEIEIDAGVIEMQLAPTCSDKAVVPLTLIFAPVIAMVPSGQFSSQFPTWFIRRLLPCATVSD